MSGKLVNSDSGQGQEEVRSEPANWQTHGDSERKEPITRVVQSARDGWLHVHVYK